MGRIRRRAEIGDQRLMQLDRWHDAAFICRSTRCRVLAFKRAFSILAASEIRSPEYSSSSMKARVDRRASKMLACSRFPILSMASRIRLISDGSKGRVGGAYSLGGFSFWARFRAIQPRSTENAQKARQPFELLAKHGGLCWFILIAPAPRGTKAGESFDGE